MNIQFSQVYILNKCLSIKIRLSFIKIRLSFMKALVKLQSSNSFTKYTLIRYLFVSLQSNTYGMQSKGCLGCRTYFEQSESLSLETMKYEYKNYDIPLSDGKHKWSLLKTIVSFLNSKGGTIFVGVEDNNCKVVGKLLSGKVRDEFKLTLKHLTERIVPAIDLTDKEELSVQFIPVVKGKSFSGRYVTKINVKQGEPTQTYCFVQKLQIQSETKQNVGDNFQVVYSYVRHNMGGTEQLTGLKLVQQSARKALNPPGFTNTFHEECNPEPSEFQVQIKKIGFKGLGPRDKRRQFQQMFKANLEKLQVAYEFSYETQRETLLIEFQTIDQFKKVNNFILANLSFLNESQDEVRFVDSGEFLDFYLYENTLSSKSGKSTVQKESPRKQNIPHKAEKVEIKPKKYSEQIEEKKQSTASNRKFGMTFTHIAPHLRQSLLNYLTVSISKKMKIEYTLYENTIQVFLQSKEDLVKYANSCNQTNNDRALAEFGFRGQIRSGNNTGHLHILNYDKKKLKELKAFMTNLMGKSLKQIDVLKNGNRYILDCRMSKKGDACEWLDLLLKNKDIKYFKMPGAQNGSAAKMKIFIETEAIQKH